VELVDVSLADSMVDRGRDRRRHASHMRAAGVKTQIWKLGVNQSLIVGVAITNDDEVD
jgi:hypothetical protein